ncbi:MAG TPA: phenylalanine--tRNA ligase subunit beta [Gemmatimonadales bacterium]|nr:phenylalanine--tRNA ligase subunit beta [Gemmatimonadales bacterium]
MIVSRRWLESLLGKPLDAADAARRITMAAVPVDAVVPRHRDLGDVLIARVLEVKRHPNADRLSLCLVDAGGAGGPLEVVCGAPNVQAGKTYPFAPVGAVLPGGLKLDRRKIRGVESNGMLCSAKELGLGDDHAGILELATDAAPGTKFLDIEPIADDQIVFDVTANRPDLLCHKGVARELGASLGAVVKLPEFPAASRVAMPAPRRADREGKVDSVKVKLEDPEGAPRYMIAVIRGVRVGPSPRWLAQRLEAVGQRAINNIVDATNYILLELNQPLHAFDLAKLRGPAVVVRRAKAKEQIKTLDGVTRELSPEMTAICDAERPTIVAGVMGSADSEVTAATTDIVLECAYFQPARIRRTRRALDLSSESSYRFERGIDLFAMPDALRRAVDLITTVAGGTMREPAIDLWPEPQQERTVFLRPARVAHLLGVPVERSEIEKRLLSVGFVVAPKDDRLAVQVPGWRPDVGGEVDLIEEVARLKGYDSFPDELRPYRPGTVPDAAVEQAKARVRAQLVRAGLYEARTLALVPPDGPEAVPILNPLSSTEAHLRSRLLPELVRRVEHNWAGLVRDVRLFEIGTVFRKGKEARPEEHTAVAAVLTGARRPQHWSEGAKVPDMDLWDLKWHFELALTLANRAASLRETPDGAGWEAIDAAGAVVGWAGPLEGDAPKWAAPLFGYEVRLLTDGAVVAQYRPLPTTPPVEHDVALVLPDGVSAAAVEAVLRRAAGPLLERIAVFDEYRGAGIAAGTRSVAWHLVFRAPDRTLREAEVETLVRAAVTAVEGELGVRRREG